jgi:hypothetical protein
MLRQLLLDDARQHLVDLSDILFALLKLFRDSVRPEKCRDELIGVSCSAVGSPTAFISSSMVSP